MAVHKPASWSRFDVDNIANSNDLHIAPQEGVSRFKIACEDTASVARFGDVCLAQKAFSASNNVRYSGGVMIAMCKAELPKKEAKVRNCKLSISHFRIHQSPGAKPRQVVQETTA